MPQDQERRTLANLCRPGFGDLRLLLIVKHEQFEWTSIDAALLVNLFKVHLHAAHHFLTPRRAFLPTQRAGKGNMDGRWSRLLLPVEPYTKRGSHCQYKDSGPGQKTCTLVTLQEPAQ